ERQWQQVAKAVRPCLLDKIRQLDFEVAAKLPEDLTTRAAGWRGCVRLGHDRQSRERAVPLRQRLEHRDSLGAHGQAVRGVLDVTAGDDGAVGGLERSAHREV